MSSLEDSMFGWPGFDDIGKAIIRYQDKLLNWELASIDAEAVLFFTHQWICKHFHHTHTFDDGFLTVLGVNSVVLKILAGEFEEMATVAPWKPAACRRTRMGRCHGWKRTLQIGSGREKVSTRSATIALETGGALVVSLYRHGEAGMLAMHVDGDTQKECVALVDATALAEMATALRTLATVAPPPAVNLVDYEQAA